jgi:hypothetical protein
MTKYAIQTGLCILIAAAVAATAGWAQQHPLDDFVDQYRLLTTVEAFATATADLEGDDPVRMTYRYSEGDGRLRHEFEAPEPSLSVLYIFDGERFWRTYGEMETVMVGTQVEAPKIPSSFENPLLLPLEFLNADPAAGCTFCQIPIAEVAEVWERIRAGRADGLEFEGTLNHDSEIGGLTRWTVETTRVEELVVPSAIERRQEGRPAVVSTFSGYRRFGEVILPTTIGISSGDEVSVELRVTYEVNGEIPPEAFEIEADHPVYDEDRARFDS